MKERARFDSAFDMKDFSLGLLSGVIFGTVLGLVGVFIAAMAWRFPEGDAHDYIQFFGALTGSAITVAGALFVVSYQTKSTQRRHHKTISTMVANAQRIEERIKELMAAKGAGKDKASIQFHALAKSLKAIETTADRLRVESPEIAWQAACIDGIPDVFDVQVRRWAAAMTDDWRPSARDLLQFPSDILSDMRLGLDDEE